MTSVPSMVEAPSLSEAAEMMKSMSDPTRMRLLALLVQHNELCVCDLMTVTGLAQTNVSRHLAVLRHTGWVQDRKQGMWVYYSLVKPTTEYHKGLLRTIKSASQSIPELLEDSISLKKACCC